MLKKLLPQPALTAALIVVWLLLLNDLTFGGLVLALAIGLAIPIFTSRFWPDRPRIRWGPAMIGYALVVLWDIVVANFEVAYVIVFRKNASLRSGWLVVPLELRSPEAISVLAATISLTPGTVSSDVSADGQALLVHALDAADHEAVVGRIKSRYEARLLRIFE